MKNVKILRLTTGEEIVTEINEDGDLVNPLIVMKSVNAEGIYHNLSSWMVSQFMTDDGEITKEDKIVQYNPAHVVASMKPVEIIKKQYFNTVKYIMDDEQSTMTGSEIEAVTAEDLLDSDQDGIIVFPGNNTVN